MVYGNDFIPRPLAVERAAQIQRGEKVLGGQRKALDRLATDILDLTRPRSSAGLVQVHSLHRQTNDK